MVSIFIWCQIWTFGTISIGRRCSKCMQPQKNSSVGAVEAHASRVLCCRYVCCGCVVVKTGANELDTLTLVIIDLLTQKMGKDMLQQRG